MTPYICLLRGINVGGKHILRMKELSQLLTHLGHTRVKTYIQSGNIAFYTPQNDTLKIANDIKAQILLEHGFEPQVMLLKKADLDLAITHNPFPTDSGKALHFYFLSGPPQTPALDKLKAFQSESEAFELKGQVFYLYTPEGMGRSKLASKAEKHLGVSATARNWNTVQKLQSLSI